MSFSFDGLVKWLEKNQDEKNDPPVEELQEVTCEGGVKLPQIGASVG